MAAHYTIGELMSIDSTRQDKAKKSTVSLIKVYHELQKDTVLDKFKSLIGRPQIKRYKLVFKFEVTSDTGNKHKVFIRIDPDFNLSNVNSNRADIYCDCADFKYRSAYILGKKNSLFLNNKIKADLGNSITEAPKKVSTTILCKQSFAALSWLVDNYANVMKTV